MNGFHLKVLGLFLISGISANAQELQKAIQWLSKTSTGASMLEKANQYRIPIQGSKISKTDLTATRVTDVNGERLEFRASIFVSTEKEPVFQALDLAHELTHALNPNTNPFDPHLTAKDYIENGIESKGGEAQAILNECAVGRELVQSVELKLKKETAELIKARCQVVWNKSKEDSVWKDTFYQLGHHYDEFINRVSQLQGSEKEKELEHWETKAQPRSPLFSSAVSKKPYPLALLEEYIEITRNICARTQSSFLGRSIASTSALQNRCHSVSQN